MQVSTLRPGLLISLKSSVTGNVSYSKRDIERDHATSDGARRAVWETERQIADAEEFETATQVRGQCRALITRLCSPSNFGLLCPEDRRGELATAVDEAREIADKFNMGARLTTVSVHVLIGRVSADDTEAVRAINSEVRTLLDQMERGIAKMDPDAIRKAALEARTLGQMLSPSASEQVNRAIEQARAAATRIKKGAEVAAEVAAAQVRIIKSARNAFLDLDDAAPMQRPDDTSGRSVDFIPEDAAPIVAKSAQAVVLDL